MDGLIVVHTDIKYLDPNIQNLGTREQFVNLFDRIAQEVGEQLQRGNRVYLLGEKSNSTEGELIYPAIRAHLPDLTYIPLPGEVGSYAIQFLRLKEQVMEDGIERSQVSGVNYRACVREVYQLLVGESRLLELVEFHQVAVRGMGWSPEKLEEILSTELNARIRGGLTNKPFKQDTGSTG